jgi:hypothetical protein
MRTRPIPVPGTYMCTSIGTLPWYQLVPIGTWYLRHGYACFTSRLIRGYTGTQCTCDWYTNTGTQCTWHVYVYVRTMLPHHCKVVSQLCTTTIMLCHILDVLFEIMFFVRTRHVYVLASAHTTADIGKRYAGHRSQITTPRSSWRT